MPTRVEKILSSVAGFPEHAQLAREACRSGMSYSSFAKILLEELSASRPRGQDVRGRRHERWIMGARDWLILEACGRIPGSMSAQERSNRARYAEVVGSEIDTRKGRLLGVADAVSRHVEGDLYERAFAGMSDFPALLADVFQQLLAGFFSEQEKPWQSVARIRRVENFLPGTVVKADFPNLIATPEGVPVPEGFPHDASQGFQIGTHARSISIGRQALLSDQLGALSSSAEAAAIGTARTVADTVFGRLLQNPVMNEDNVPLFGAHTSGSNTVAASLDADGLASVIALIRSQRGLSRAGETGPAMNLKPFAVLVPPALEGKARSVIGNFGTATDLQVLVEPRLTPATTFYCIARGPGLEIEALNDNLVPTVQRFPGATILGMTLNIILDFSCSIIEHRTWARGTA